MSEALPPAEFAKALQRKRAASRRRKFAIIGGLGAVVIVGALVGYLLLFSSVFAAREVRATGTERVSQEEVTRIAEVSLGSPLLRQDTAAIASRVESLPAVRDAEVVLDWPSTVEIRVTEREPAFQIASAEGYELVDEEAVIFERGTEAVEGVPVATVDAGDERLLRDVATVANAIPDPVREQLVSIRATSVDQIVLELTDDREVVWGSAESSDLKAEVITALLPVDATVYDVSAPQNPTTRK